MATWVILRRVAAVAGVRAGGAADRLFSGAVMSLPKPDLHVRLCEEAKAKLRLMAEVEQLPESVLAAHYLEEVLMGKAHVLKVAARRLMRAGLDGRDGE